MSVDFALGWIRSRLGADSGADKVADWAADRATAFSRTEGLAALAQVAGALGSPVDPQVLAHVLDMDVDRLRRCLDLLVADGQLEFSAGAFAICAGLPEITLPPETVALMHHRAADYLSKLPPPVDRQRASRIGSHYQAAGCLAEAFLWWCEACTLALAEGGVRVAFDHLQRALSICGANAGAVQPEDELAALNLMGPICAQLEGSGADEVAAVYSRSADLAHQTMDEKYAGKFNSLWGLTACILVHGRMDTARELASKLVRIAEVSSNSGSMLLAARLSGLGNLLAGELSAAIQDFSTVGRLYRRDRHADLRFKYASDQGAVALAHKAWAETIAGRACEAERSGHMALELANAIRHPHTSAHVACVLAARAQVLNDRGVAAPLAIAAQSLAKRHDFAYWMAWSELILAWHAGLRDPTEGIVRLRAGIAAYRRTGAVQALPYAHLILADLALAAGDRQLTYDAAAMGLAITDSSGVRLFEAEIMRVKASATAEGPVRKQLMQTAAVVARRQGAHLFQARALQALAGTELNLETNSFAN